MSNERKRIAKLWYSLNLGNVGFVCLPLEYGYQQDSVWEKLIEHTMIKRIAPPIKMVQKATGEKMSRSSAKSLDTDIFTSYFQDSMEVLKKLLDLQVQQRAQMSDVVSRHKKYEPAAFLGVLSF